MSEYGLSEEHQALTAMVRRFATEVIAPQIGDLYVKEEFPYEIVAQLGELGIFGLPFGEEWGGQGGDYLAFCLAIEEIARIDSSVAATLEAAVGLGSVPLMRFGTDAQKKQWLPDLVAGRTVGAFGLTEPDGGSDAGATRTTARLDGDQWVINGSKAFITNSGTDITSIITVTAVTGQKANGGKEISAIIVPAGTAGLTVAPKYSKVGWNCSDTHALSFDDVRVPADNLLGERGRGYAQFLQTLDEGRIAISALGVGLAQGCVDECVKYAQERSAFGQPIAKYQSIAFKIADMQTRAHTSPVPPITTPPSDFSPARISSEKRRSRSSTAPRSRWTTRGTRRRSTAAMAS